MSGSKQRRLPGLALLCLALAYPLAAETPAEDRLERLRADRWRAAEQALIRAAAPLPEVVPPAEPPPTEEQALKDAAPPWPSRLSAADWARMRQHFSAEGVPAELVAVGWVESRFNAAAVSPKGARGIWQLMPATARQYGLVVTPQRDERTDLERSTRAAARYLADLYARFGDWPLALAAYNAGPERVEAALGRGRSRDFSALRPWLPVETRLYVPAVLAAADSSALGAARRPAASRSAARFFALVTPPQP
ncbi:MAG: lytic transglycosylase domain-containing protein [Acidobacteria bacterium]|nr:lytic transglycosylase domain-containing protein [Acidobacteriota bacterium]